MKPPLLLGLFIFISLAEPALCVTPEDVPAGSTAGVIRSKIQEESEEEIEEKEIPPELKLETVSMAQEESEARFFVKKIRIRPFGELTQKALDSLVDPHALQAVLAPYEGREVVFKELLEMKENVELLYRLHGYFAVARISPEEIKEEVIVEVLFSRLGKVALDGRRYFREKKTLSYWHVPQGKILRYDDIVRNIYAMNENPDRAVKPLLKAGIEPGTTDIILKSEEHFPLHGSFTMDNEGAKLTGDERFNVMLRHNNLFSLDDTFLIGSSFGEQFGALFLQHKIPLNTLGTSFRYGFSHAQVNPKKEFKEFGINGISQSYSMALDQNLIRDERMRLDMDFGIDFKEKRTEALSVTSVWDRLRVVHADVSFQRRDRWGLWSGNQSFNFSFSPHGDGFPLTSRQAETQFFKYEFVLQRRHRLPFQTELTTRLSGQLSPNKLVPQEELFMGGATTVRGYPDSDYGADQGLVWNVEWRVPLYFIPRDWKLSRDSMALQDRVRLVSFFDQGYGRLNDASERELRSRTLLGAGGGFEVRLWDHFLTRCFWAAALGDDPITENGSSQFHFLFTAEL